MVGDRCFTLVSWTITLHGLIATLVFFGFDGSKVLCIICCFSFFLLGWAIDIEELGGGFKVFCCFYACLGNDSEFDHVYIFFLYTHVPSFSHGLKPPTLDKHSGQLLQHQNLKLQEVG